MRLENFMLHLYCDNKDAHNRFASVWIMGFIRVTGRNLSECKRKARRAGWKLSKDKKHDLCPSCHKKWKADRKKSRDKKNAERINVNGPPS